MNSESNPISRKLSKAAAWMARLFFCVTIILIPFRFRYELVERPALPIYKDFTDFLLFGSDIAVLALLAFWGLSLLLIWRPVRPGPNFMWLPQMGLIFICLITSFTSLDVELSLYHTLRLVCLFLLYLYVVNEVRSRLLVLAAVGIQMIVQSLIALAQFFLQRSISLRVFGEHDLDPAVRGVSIVSTGTSRVLRSYGLTEHPNVLGGCLALGLILFLAIYLHGPPRVQKGAGLVILLGLPALFVTFSRSAWLAFFCGVVFLVAGVVFTRNWKKIPLLLWLVLAGLLVLAPLVREYSGYVGARFNVEDSFIKNPYENRSIGERLLLDKVGLQIFSDRPISGVGLGASALAVKEYFPHFRGSFVPPHLVLLAVAMETGIIGFILFMCLLLFPWIALKRNKINPLRNPTLLACSILLIAITLIGLLDIYPWLLPPGRLWQWLAWGLWAVAYESERSTLLTPLMPD